MPVAVEGLRELNRAYKNVERDVRLGLRKELRQAAEPVRSGAETRAVVHIRNIGPAWSRMRVGVTQTSVYVAPRKRGSRAAGRKRPNLADLLMTRAMEPSLAASQEKVVHDIDQVLGRAASRFNRGF